MILKILVATPWVWSRLHSTGTLALYDKREGRYIQISHRRFLENCGHGGGGRRGIDRFNIPCHSAHQCAVVDYIWFRGLCGRCACGVRVVCVWGAGRVQKGEKTLVRGFSNGTFEATSINLNGAPALYAPTRPKGEGAKSQWRLDASIATNRSSSSVLSDRRLHQDLAGNQPVGAALFPTTIDLHLFFSFFFFFSLAQARFFFVTFPFFSLVPFLPSPASSLHYIEIELYAPPADTYPIPTRGCVGRGHGILVEGHHFRDASFGETCTF